MPSHPTGSAYPSSPHIMEASKTIYLIRVRENGDVIDTCDTIEEAKKEIERYEAEDKAEGIYEPFFYEILETER